MKFEAIGISNMAYDRENRKAYSVQFYDYDIHDPPQMLNAIFNTIQDSVFPFDCIVYETKHGYHFISFALFETTYYTKGKALELTTFLGNQDYWCSQKDLILRISPKWDFKHKRKIAKTISKKPKFYRFLSPPNNCLISKSHLEFYYKFMGLPKDVYDTYRNCPSRRLDLKLYFYNARD
jgi:hypothetical protein